MSPRKPTSPELVPLRIEKPTIDDHLAIVTRAAFQAGLSWAMIAERWGDFCAAFDDFRCAIVATYGEADVERLMEAPRVIHSRKKIEGTIANAKALLSLAQTHGSVDGYLAHFASYADCLRDVRKRFTSIGDLSCYYWRFRTGAPVPRFEDWLAMQDADHPRMREMVLRGRADGTSTESVGF